MVVGALTASSAGCLSLSCEPQLDVRHCLPDQPRCTPRDGDPVVPAGDPSLAGWPGLRDLLESTPAGEHRHATWNRTTEEAFWTAYGVDLDQEGKRLWVQDGEELFRVHVLSC